MSFYETVFIIRPDVSITQVDNITKELTEVIKKTSGKVERTESWGLRTIAYPIKKNKKGHYVMFQLSGTGETVSEFERQCRIHEDVLRFMTIKIDEISKEDSPLARQEKSVQAA